MEERQRQKAKHIKQLSTEETNEANQSNIERSLIVLKLFPLHCRLINPPPFIKCVTALNIVIIFGYLKKKLLSESIIIHLSRTFNATGIG